MDNTILYNEETTAQTLNNIAVDLGKTDFSVFSDGETYAVTKLNEITSSLVSKGILTSGNRCKPTISGEILEIADGIIVFESGQKIKITEPIQLTVSQTGTYYIYAVNNLEANTASVEVKTEELLAGDYVPLCTVTDGALTDMRVFAKAKIDLLSEGNSYCREFYLPFRDIFPSYSGELDFNITASNTASIFFQLDGYTLGMYDRKTKSYNQYDGKSGITDGSNLSGYVANGYANILIVENDDILTVNVYQYGNPIHNSTIKVFVFDGTESTN